MKIVIGQEMYFRNDYGGPIIPGVIDHINRSKPIYVYSVTWSDGIRNCYSDSEIIQFMHKYDPYFLDFFDKIRDRMPTYGF